MKPVLRRLLDESNHRPERTASGSPNEDELLDAYSEAVATAAEKISPSVANVEVFRRDG